jgi:hypothetical protein
MANWWATFKKLMIFIPTVIKIAKEVGKAIEELSSKVKDWWNGKKIAVLGPTAVGKNCFYQRLKGEIISKQHIQTTASERIPPFIYRHNLPDGREFKIVCKNSINVGGEVDKRELFWIDACKDSDVIFYMMTVTDLKDEKYKPGQRIYDDLKWLATNMGKFKHNTLIHFLINKIDMDLVNGEKYNEYINELEPNIKEFERAAKNIFGPYESRLTCITPTSMLDDHIFAISFPKALEAVYNAVHA